MVGVSSDAQHLPNGYKEDLCITDWTPGLVVVDIVYYATCTCCF